MSKLCVSCGVLFSGGRADRKYCSASCGNRARRKKHYDSNAAYYYEKRKKERRRIETSILTRVKCRAKSNNIEFNLTVEDIIVPKVCPVLGITLTFNFGKGSGYHDDSPSVDRIDPNKGYIKGNVRVISARANLLKSNATPQELEAVLQDLRRIHVPDSDI